jgi:hypothetical protein
MEKGTRGEQEKYENMGTWEIFLNSKVCEERERERERERKRERERSEYLYVYARRGSSIVLHEVGLPMIHPFGL